MKQLKKAIGSSRVLRTHKMTAHQLGATVDLSPVRGIQRARCNTAERGAMRALSRLNNLAATQSTLIPEGLHALRNDSEQWLAPQFHEGNWLAEHQALSSTPEHQSSSVN